MKKLKNAEAFPDHSQPIDDVYENLEGYDDPAKKNKVLIVFDDIIENKKANKKIKS